MALIKNFIPETQYSTKCPYTMAPKGICIHNTANDASAIQERNNVARDSNTTEVSFHIAIDDKEAIQLIPFNRNAWHAGDGGQGQGNRNYISIEICYSLSGGERFINAEKRAAKEIAALLKQYGWTLANVKKHQDFSGKYCPHRTLDTGYQRFLNMIQAELNILNGSNTNNTSNTNVNNTNSNNTNANSNQTQNTAEEYIIKEYKEIGTFTCTVNSIYFRNKPIISSNNPTQGQYLKNEKVNYDYVVITNKYIYISWVSANSGVRRYMPITDKTTGEKWGYVV